MHTCKRAYMHTCVYTHMQIYMLVYMIFLRILHDVSISTTSREQVREIELPGGSELDIWCRCNRITKALRVDRADGVV